jgi:hypothetical protein
MWWIHFGLNLENKGCSTFSALLPGIASRSGVQDCTIFSRAGPETFHIISGFLPPLAEPLIAF